MRSPQDYAVTVTRYEHAELLPTPLDDSPLGAHDIAGATLASLISAGTELAAVYGGSNFPAVPGYAAVFRVEEVGSEVESVQVGDHVFCMGNHCSWQRHAEDMVVKVPSGLSAERAVFARLMAVTMSTLTTTTARPPGRVVVAGLGPVGHLAAKIFAACGYEVLACDPDSARRALAEQNGVRTTAMMPLDDPQWADRTALVLECSGHEQAVLDGCKLVAKRGEVVLVGVPWKRRTELFAHDILHAVFHRYVVLRSGWEWEVPMHPTEFRSGGIMENVRAALSWLADGRISVDSLYAEYSPADCQNAYQNLLHHREEKLAVIFNWTK